MKFLHKSCRTRRLMFAYILFCLIFPYSLFAENQTYKVPRNSISYFVDETEKGKVAIVEPPEPLIQEQQGQKETKAVTPQHKIIEPAPVVSAHSEPVAVEPAEEKFSMSWKSEPAQNIEIRKKPKTIKKEPQKAVVFSSKDPVTAPIVTQKHVSSSEIKETGSHEVGVVVPSAPFSKTLARMQSRSSSREAEAQKLGIVLPSQGGNMEAVSPSLSRLNQAIKNIINRN